MVLARMLGRPDRPTKLLTEIFDSTMAYAQVTHDFISNVLLCIIFVPTSLWTARQSLRLIRICKHSQGQSLRIYADATHFTRHGPGRPGRGLCNLAAMRFHVLHKLWPCPTMIQQLVWQHTIQLGGTIAVACPFQVPQVCLVKQSPD